MSRVRMAIVGLNHYHVCGWADTLRNLDSQVEVVAIYDADPSRRETLAPDYQDPALPRTLASEFHSVPFYTDLEVLISDQRPQAALVMDYHRNNPKLVRTLAQAGIHAFLDKSGGCNASELAQAMEAAHRAGVVVGAGLTWRLNPAVRHARTLITAGELGHLMGAEVSLVSSTVQARNPQNFLFSKELSGGGFTHWLHIHFIDALMHLTGQEIVSVQAMTANTGGAPIDVEDVVAATLELDGGAIGTIFGGYVLPKWITEGHIKLHGSGLSLDIRASGLYAMNADRDRHQVELPVPPQRAAPKHHGYGGVTGVTMIEDWLQAIRDRSHSLSSSGDDLVRSLAVIDAIYASAASGRRADVQRFTE